MSQGRFAGYADRPTVDGVDGDVPETGTRCSYAGREGVESTAMVSVTAAILEAAEIGVVHQADVAHLGALDDDDVVFIEVLALVDKFHEAPPEGLFLQNQNDSMVDWRSLSARTGYYPVVGVCFDN
ncbi:hypothetical protein EMIT0P100_30044 [Pseudomonas sp. IT-P100]